MKKITYTRDWVNYDSTMCAAEDLAELRSQLLAQGFAIAEVVDA